MTCVAGRLCSALNRDDSAGRGTATRIYGAGGAERAFARGFESAAKRVPRRYVLFARCAPVARKNDGVNDMHDVRTCLQRPG
jgi:hypothetical protein